MSEPPLHKTTHVITFPSGDTRACQLHGGKYCLLDFWGVVQLPTDHPRIVSAVGARWNPDTKAIEETT